VECNEINHQLWVQEKAETQHNMHTAEKAAHTTNSKGDKWIVAKMTVDLCNLWKEEWLEFRKPINFGRGYCYV